VRFAFSEEQRLAERSVRELLERECSVEHVRAAWTSATGRIPGLWARLAELGVLGLLVPASAGGMGANELDAVLILEAVGYAALPEPLAETAIVATPLLASLENPALAGPWLERIAAGEAVLSVRLDPNPYVAHPRAADLIIAEHGAALFAVEFGRCELVEQPSVDGARSLATLKLDPERATLLATGSAARAAADAARDRAAFATAAELIGLSARMLEISVEYARTRQQFGRAIGSFQAVQHDLANALLALELARPVVYRAAYSLASQAEERSLHVSMAKAVASDAATFVGRVALQVHGAIGYSYEHHLHLFMKRAWALAASSGDAAFHRERCAIAVLGPRPNKDQPNAR
jgi:alkylation response protein AidB-like acyl-CoA dehydrogenase